MPHFLRTVEDIKKIKSEKTTAENLYMIKFIPVELYWQGLSLNY